MLFFCAVCFSLFDPHSIHAQPAIEESINPQVPQIIGGTEAEENAWPWMVALIKPDVFDNFWAQYCGGTLIAPDWVLTAAHCTYRSGGPAGPEEIQVLVTPSSLRDETSRRVRIKQIIRHPDFKRSTGGADLALIQLEQPLDRPYLRVVNLNAAQAELSDSLATVLGWGRTENVFRSDRLMEVNVPLVEQEECISAYAKLNYAVTDNMLCAGYSWGGKDACTGDSGGPLLAPQQDVNGGQIWVIIGIVSWGKGCAEPDAYGVYTRLSYFEPWIRLNVAIAQASTTTTFPTTTFYPVDGNLFTLHQIFLPYTPLP